MCHGHVKTKPGILVLTQCKYVKLRCNLDLDNDKLKLISLLLYRLFNVTKIRLPFLYSWYKIYSCNNFHCRVMNLYTYSDFDTIW